MPKVLILADHRPGRSPSQRYRFEQYLSFLEEHGCSFTWSYLLDEDDDRVFYSPGHTIRKMQIMLNTMAIRRKDEKRFGQFDIIFIQREASFLGTSRYEKKAFGSGAKVIFDFDDSIWMEDTSPGNRKWAWLKRPAKFFENVAHAHLVIAGNAYLAEKARPYAKEVRVIPTTIDTALHIPMPEHRNKDIVTIGWSGSISTIRHFELLLTVLRKLKQKYGAKLRFKIIGQKKYENAELEADCVEWTQENEVRELNSFDIGIMPLPDDEWAKGKCGLKGLSYMACGVATVMSKVGVNTEIIRDGENGFLAASDEEWTEKLCRLIDDQSLRNRLGESGRKTVVELFSVLANRGKYLEAFEALSKP